MLMCVPLSHARNVTTLLLLSAIFAGCSEVFRALVVEVNRDISCFFLQPCIATHCMFTCLYCFFLSIYQRIARCLQDSLYNMTVLAFYMLHDIVCLVG